MDLLYVPVDPAFPAPRTPYVCADEWDGGLFHAYPHRKGRTSLVPLNLRRDPGARAPEEPYLEVLHPTPRDELQPFMQTWLFVGLTAEFLGLNEVAPGVRLVDEATALREIAQLHRDLCTEHEGSRFLSGAAVLGMEPLVGQRLGLAADRGQRLAYLCDCLLHGLLILHSIQENLDETIRFSIAALGELFSSVLYRPAMLGKPGFNLPAIGFNWYRGYIGPDSTAEAQMMQGGWCPSEIDKTRTQLQSLSTMYYTSKMNKPRPHLDHGRCSQHVCRAFQIDMTTYRPLHVHGACGGACPSIGVDMASVSAILRSTEFYPVLRVQLPPDEREHLKLFVEPYKPGMSYVALSHVWADGLGNPNENALPRCQVARVARHIAALDKPGGWLWIDTLCCPTETEGKMIALQRMADVYRNAHDVLVLDASLTALKSEGRHPAELLLRTLGCSPWTRRLWTLQEGALATSLQVQFADRAVNIMALMSDMFTAAAQDLRYWRMWMDINNQFVQLSSFSPKTGHGMTLPSPPLQLTTLQRALHFRTVSVPSDEPLCIATLMKLDTHYVASVAGAEQRMARVWELLARAGGGLPPGIIVHVDEPLDVPGWRWAPRSLLGSAAENSVLGIDERIVRFAAEQGLDRPSRGIPTPLGLRVRLPGCRLAPRPRAAGLPLHPWPGVINAAEDQVLLRHESTGQWFRLCDWYRSRKISTWTDDERVAYDRRQDNPLCRVIDTGKCGLIWEPPSTVDGTRACCMVRAVDVSSEDGPSGLEAPETALAVRRERTVILSPLDKTEARVMDFVRALADNLAADSVTAEHMAMAQRSGQPWQESTARVRRRMKEVMAEAWKSHAWLRQAVADTVGEGLDDYIWAFVPKAFSHDIVLTPLPDDQLWFVD